MRVIIIHPGIQHSYRLANALQYSNLFSKVYLLTSILYPINKKPFLKSFDKRIKPIHPSIVIKNHLIYELLSKITRKIYNKLINNPNKQVHNNPIYFWQFIFALWCLPTIWWHRKNLVLVTYETAAWPISFFAKKWQIPVVMDFPSISHETAKELGINETNFGIAIKKRERKYIDYALFCSVFCRDSFVGLTSAKKDFVLYLGAEEIKNLKLKVESKVYQVLSIKYQDTNRGNEKDKIVKISFIANLEYRKGLDILLDAIYSYQYPAFLEVHLIGKIRQDWVEKHMPETILNNKVTLVYQHGMSQQELFTYLMKEQFDLNVQPSRFDSFAMVVPETMMQGIPNLVSPFVGAGEMLKNGVDGFVMSQLDSLSLAQSISSFANLTADELINLKREVLKTVAQMTWENYSREVSKTFKKILKDLNK